MKTNSFHPCRFSRTLCHYVVAAASLLILLNCSATFAHAQLSMLHTSGTSIVDANGNRVSLRGVNLGGWLLIETWMTPADTSGLPDNFSIIQTLDNRFGVATEQSLIKTYQQSWITTADLDNIRAEGMNVIRVPVWWANFETLSGQWRSDAFDMLDWVVSQAAARGIYTIIDMHGVVGAQSTSQDTGQQNLNAYWTSSADQTATNQIMMKIAAHYNGNPNVAAYDLMNEPMNAPSNQAAVNAQNNIYNAVRSQDPTHICILEGTFGSWNWDMLPPPTTFGWTNVVYEMHEYQWNGTASAVENGSVNQVNMFKNHASWNVPDYVGEFNDFAYGTDVWQFTANQYNNNNINWTVWSYKSTQGNWGLYETNSNRPPVPNIQTDSASTISNDWSQWTTANAFFLNPTLAPALFGGVNGSVKSNAWYNVVNQNSGACVDAAGFGTANGTVVQQWACGNQQSNQEWQFQPTDSGFYKVVTRGASTEAWNAANFGTGNNTPIQLWQFGGGTNEQWQPIPVGNGAFKLVGRGSGRCLDVPGASTANGVQLQLFDCNGTGAQAWKLVQQP
ncbi:MAG TPA: ricin-type beta-trefoil lectin domain protein [Candidatus Angelobacter sp.]|nr:ricin-type beta-trefoil lectin domain protein [Candidatus Angelobacter sp.]